MSSETVAGQGARARVVRSVNERGSAKKLRCLKYRRSTRLYARARYVYFEPYIDAAAAIADPTGLVDQQQRLIRQMAADARHSARTFPKAWHHMSKERARRALIRSIAQELSPSMAAKWRGTVAEPGEPEVKSIFRAAAAHYDHLLERQRRGTYQPTNQYNFLFVAGQREGTDPPR